MIVNNELGKCGRKQLWPNLRCYPGICLEGARETIFSFYYYFVINDNVCTETMQLSNRMINDYGAVGVMRTGRETELIREHLPERHFVHHKSYMI